MHNTTNTAFETNFWKFVTKQITREQHSVIPEFGEFKVLHLSSSLNPIANQYNPPTKNVIFTENNAIINELFYTALAKAENLTHADTKNSVKLVLQSLFSRLAQNNTFTVDGLGKFNGVKGFIQFTPHQLLLTDVHSFGLQPVFIKKMPSVAKKITIEKQTETATENAEALRLKALTELKQLLDKAQRNQNGVRPKKIKAFPLLATLLTLVLLANVIIFLNKDTLNPLHEAVQQMNMGVTIVKDKDNTRSNTYTHKTNTSVEGKTVDYSLHVKNLINAYTARKEYVFNTDAVFDTCNSLDGAVKNLIMVSQTADLNKEHVALVNEIPVINQNTNVVSLNDISDASDIPTKTVSASANNIEAGYYIVAGVFRSGENAHNYRNVLQNKGFKFSAILKPLRSRYRMVVFQKFNNKSDAIKAHQVFVHESNEAWIYEAR